MYIRFLRLIFLLEPHVFFSHRIVLCGLESFEVVCFVMNNILLSLDIFVEIKSNIFGWLYLEEYQLWTSDEEEEYLSYVCAAVPEVVE